MDDLEIVRRLLASANDPFYQKLLQMASPAVGSQFANAQLPDVLRMAFNNAGPVAPAAPEFQPTPTNPIEVRTGQYGYPGAAPQENQHGGYSQRQSGRQNPDYYGGGGQRYELQQRRLDQGDRRADQADTAAQNQIIMRLLDENPSMDPEVAASAARALTGQEEATPDLFNALRVARFRQQDKQRRQDKMKYIADKLQGVKVPNRLPDGTVEKNFDGSPVLVPLDPTDESQSSAYKAYTQKYADEYDAMFPPEAEPAATADKRPVQSLANQGIYSEVDTSKPGKYGPGIKYYKNRQPDQAAPTESPVTQEKTIPYQGGSSNLADLRREKIAGGEVVKNAGDAAVAEAKRYNPKLTPDQERTIRSQAESDAARSQQSNEALKQRLGKLTQPTQDDLIAGNIVKTLRADRSPKTLKEIEDSIRALPLSESEKQRWRTFLQQLLADPSFA